MAQSNSSSVAQGPDDDIPRLGQQFAQFGAGCFWGVELAFQRVPGVTKTEVGYTRGHLHYPTYNDVCSETTNHSEVVRVQYDPKECDYGSLLDVFWGRHDPTTLNRQVVNNQKLYLVGDNWECIEWAQCALSGSSSSVKGNDVGTQYRSGIYYYTPEQEKAAFETLERQQKLLNRQADCN